MVCADRWYPSSKRCSACGEINAKLTLSDRLFVCACGFRTDRDLNAAVNLALWAATHQQDFLRSPDLPAGGRVINARRREGADRHPGVGETIADDAGTPSHPVRV
ncbi:zinc ribbon domain-containing protein [Nocardia sp. NBC_00511]|uniref:zinc ribbon domain-containing protein n=1 Tax=Nocardia sp. NBC_00511 TaxID=2903591 RepID=UPI0030E2F4B7